MNNDTGTRVSHTMSRQRNHYGRRAANRGVGLIEVLIAVLVMGVGFLGIAALQATTLRNSQSSLERSQAVVQTYAILDAMRANVEVARIGGYNLNRTCTLPTGGTLVTDDWRSWIEALHGSLGGGACGTISCVDRMCEITVEWDDSRGSGGDAAQQLKTRTGL